MNGLFLDRIEMHTAPSEDTYPGCLPVVKALKKLGKLEFSSPVTFFVGENGVGKSTLIEAIAVALGFNPEGGSRNFDFSTCASHSDLYKYLTASRRVTGGRTRRRDGYFLRAESFYNVASYIDELDSIPAAAPPLISSYGGISLHHQSHGESFMALVEHRFGGDGIYILDEPEAALSPARLLRLLVLMRELVEKNSQFIISTHSPILMAYPGAVIYELTEDGIAPTAYRDTAHYQLTKRFLEDPERMFSYLFED